jgi:mRNA-degrading endonuclease toxin of MazEF toxin-antitoxin module
MDLEVPDFTKAPLSLSGVLLQDGATAAVTPDDVFRTLVPVTATSRREFARGEPLTAFVRVYQGGRDPMGRVNVRAQITTSSGAIVVDNVSTLERDEFSTERAADYQLALPLERLAPGEYLLTIDATLGTSGTSRRDVRFSVR